MSQRTLTFLCSIFALLLVLFAVTTSKNEKSISVETSVPVVRVQNGFQVISVIAKGGYIPNQVSASAEIPTRLEIMTRGNYDCSSAFTIPSLGYRKMLPPNGITPIDIPPQPKGTTIRAVCSMGMYFLEIKFN